MAYANLQDIGLYIHSQTAAITRGLEWYILYFAFQSSLTLLLSAVWEPGHPSASSWREVSVGNKGSQSDLVLIDSRSASDHSVNSGMVS